MVNLHSNVFSKTLRMLGVLFLCISSVAVVMIATACSSEAPPTFEESDSNDGSIIGTQIELFGGLGFLPAGDSDLSGFNNLPAATRAQANNNREVYYQYLPKIFRANEALTEGEHFTVNDLPGGLTVQVLANKSTLTISLTGKAKKHQGANSVENFTVKVINGVGIFPSQRETSVYMYKDAKREEEFRFGIAFDDNGAPTLTYSGDTFSEAAANDGSIGNSINLTLSGDTFTESSGTLIHGVDFILGSGSKVPAGLTPVITLTSNTTATFSLTGQASTHEAANNLPQILLEWTSRTFSNGKIPASKHFSIEFTDAALPAPALTYSATGVNESAANSGAISQTIDITLANDTFVSGPFVASTHYTLTGTSVPSGLTATLTRLSDTTARLAFTGSAASHAAANNVTGITLSFLAAAFSRASLPTNGSESQNVSITFKDPYHLTYSATTFVENSTNLGGISDTVDMTLTNDTYAISSGTFTANTHYTITGVPAGLTAVLTRMSATVARLSFTGAATSHQTADDTSSIVFTMLGAALTGGTAPSDGSQTQTFSMDFADSFILLYSAGLQSNGNLGGRSGADATCLSEKPITAGQPHVRAFISVSATDELQDMPTLYSISTSHAVKSSSGTSMATNWADLIDGSISANLLMGGILLMPEGVWTGSDNSGAIGSNHCNGWTSDSSGDSGTAGAAITSSNWLNVGDATCDLAAHLLCVAFE